MIARVATGMALAAVLAGCMATAAPPQHVAEKPDPSIGQKRWPQKPYNMRLCPTVTPRGESHFLRRDCKPLQAPFTVERRITGEYGITLGYQVRLDDGQTGIVDSFTYTDSDETHKAQIAEKAACDKKGGVSIGMTRAQVYASCWGKPVRTNTTTTANGDHEQLVYGGGYVYIRNGVVTSIQTSR